jgi:hypothetical protein
VRLVPPRLEGEAVMTRDRISYNTPTTFTGPDVLMDTVDEIVLHRATVHIEMLGDDHAYFHFTRDGQEVRGHLTAAPLSRADRRQIRRRRRETAGDLVRDLATGRMKILGPWWRIPLVVIGAWRDTPSVALLITVEDDELDIGEAP